ncbi:MAG: LamG domain-containing protein, partial [Armatimonadota bacterium]
MASANADDGLVLHLTFDEPGAVARDASGNANHGKLVGDPVRIGTGVSGGALQFDGVDDYIECLPGSTAGLGAGDFTLELWLKTETRGHWQQLVSVGRKGTERGYVGLALRDNGLPQGCYSCTAADGTRHDKRRIGTVSLPPLFDWEPVTNGRWHHLAMVADRDENRGIPRLYRDGLEDTRGGFHSRGDASAIAVTNAEGLLIGARAPAPDKLYQGVLDEVRIYRRALTADEVRSHYEAYRTAQGPPKLAPTATLVRRTAGDTNWELKHFVIMPWGGPSLNPDPEGHDALPEVIKQAHFTTVLCGLDKLELCRQWGFKALLSGVTPDKAAELRDDEAVWGYMIKDE